MFKGALASTSSKRTKVNQHLYVTRSLFHSQIGAFNKIFSLKFENGSELIAKIPYPFVSPRQLCTASEVATMDYARTILGLPVPQVKTWSSNAETNDVGVEYILMEKCDGDVLQSRYDTLRHHGVDFVRELTEVEKKFATRKFAYMGSLYYKEDVAPSLQNLPLYADGRPDDGAEARFRVGPSVDWTLWQGTRAHLDMFRGPCDTVFLNIRENNKADIHSFRAGRHFLAYILRSNSAGMAQKWSVSASSEWFTSSNCM